MPRPLCCEGVTYVLPCAEPDAWAVCCTDCDRVLAVVHGRRDEVYADL